MKITCENCGALIDTEHDRTCKNCGAPYSSNKEYKNLKDIKQKNTDYDFREREADIRTKELGNQVIEKTLNVQKKFSILPIFVFIIIIAAMAFIGYKIFSFNGTSSSIINKEYNVAFNENAETKYYDIKCDEISNYKSDEFDIKLKPEGLEYYNFHIIFNNKSKTWATLSDIALTYTDDKGNENISANRHSQNIEEIRTALPSIATNQLTYSGNIAFEIPDYVTDVKIVYQKTTITINNFKTYIK